MNKFDFDELMRSVQDESADDTFRDELLTRSQRSLSRGRFKRRAFKQLSFFSCIVLVAAGAFLCGRFSSESQSGNLQLGVGGENVVVSAELVAWLDAGKFFEQIGMHDWATKAYKKASKMIPSQNLEQHAFGTDQTMQLACLLNRAEAAANEKMSTAKPDNCMLAVITINQ